MSKRTLFLIFALFLIAFVLLMLTVYQPQALKTTQETVIKEPIAQTTLSFGNPSIATSSSISTTNYSLPINIQSGKNKVTAVQLELQYDPKILTKVAVIPGSFFAIPEVLLNQIDTETGRISYAFGAKLTDPGVVGKGIVANLTFSVTAPGIPEKTAIIFLPKTLVTAEGISETVLKQTTNGLFTIRETLSTPSAAAFK
jgi:hypothetical protein